MDNEEFLLAIAKRIMKLEADRDYLIEQIKTIIDVLVDAEIIGGNDYVEEEDAG